jgi:hypothetical protein
MSLIFDFLQILEENTLISYESVAKVWTEFYFSFLRKKIEIDQISGKKCTENIFKWLWLSNHWTKMLFGYIGKEFEKNIKHLITPIFWKSLSLPFFGFFKLFLTNFFFLNFWKYCIDKILVQQRKSEVLLKNPCHFSDNQEKAQDFWSIFFVILDSCFTNVHTQKLMLE